MTSPAADAPRPGPAAPSPEAPGGGRAAALQLLLVSVAVIFFETMAIRWIGTHIKVIAYFGNLILIACFLGLGAGYLLSSTRVALGRLLPAALFLFVAGVTLLGHANLIDAPDGEHLHIYRFQDVPVPYKVSFFAVVISAFVLTTLTFVPLGQVLGRLFARVHGPLRAYGLHLAGNVAGALLFMLLSYLWTSPMVWFACLWLLVLPFAVTGWRTLLVGLALAAATMVLLPAARIGPVEYWSPYYHVQLEPLRTREGASLGYKLLVDGQRHQDSLAFEQDAFRRSWLAWWDESYRMPYRFARPRSVLVLGAGSGNDVHFALRAQVPRIVAVEIDPAIIRVGRSWHPERPYADPRVQVVNDDARAFLTNTHEKFDLIVLAVLDSQRLATNIAVGLRLDNFMYTVESFRLIREHLTDHGVLVLQNGGPVWLLARTYNSLTEAFGKRPDVYAVDGVNWIVHFVVGAGAANPPPLTSAGLHHVRTHERTSDFGTLTDDWPYLYLESHAIPPGHLHVLFALLGIAGVAILVLARRGRAAGEQSLDGATVVHYLALGAGFLLLETASISRTAVLLGCTWLTTSAMVVVLLCYSLLANAIVARWRRVPVGLGYALLLLALVACYLLPLSALLRYPLGARLALGAVVLGLPVLFSGLVFSTSFRDETGPVGPLSANLFGAICGGLLEHVALLTGTRALYLIALVLYLVSLLALRRRRRPRQASAAPVAAA